MSDRNNSFAIRANALQRGARRHAAAATFEPLEGRRMMSVSTADAGLTLAGGGILNVAGNTTNDLYYVARPRPAQPSVEPWPDNTTY